MTPLEILSATINGTPTPRIPIFCNLIDQGAKELKMSPEEYFSKGEHVAEAQLKMLKKYGHDNAWGLHYVGKEAELLGCKKILFSEDGVPNVADFVIKSFDDIEKFEIPTKITEHPAWESTAHCLAQLNDTLGKTHPICGYATASTTLPVLLMGMEKWLELLLIGPKDLRDELLRKCSDFFQQHLAALRNAGANVIIYSTPFGSPNLISHKMIKDWCLPWMKRDLQKDNLEGVVYYCGMAGFNSVIDLVFEELAIKAFYISPLADLTEAKRIINTRGLTCGVIDDIKMIHWSEEQIYNEVKAIIEIGKQNGHFLFGTGVMPQAIPETNIRAMLDAAFEFGSFE